MREERDRREGINRSGDEVDMARGRTVFSWGRLFVAACDCSRRRRRRRLSALGSAHVQPCLQEGTTILILNKKLF
jgi:hypothetical protein